MIHPDIDVYLPQVIELLRKHKVKTAYFFGSVLSENFNDESDVDVLIELQEGLNPVDAGGHLWDLYYGLKELLKREIDLITERSLKNPYFINEVNQKKIAHLWVTTKKVIIG